MTASMLDLDIKKNPFSRRGSWMSLSCPQREDYQPLGPGLYLRTHHSRPMVERELFRLELVDDNRVLDFTIQASPSTLRLLDSTGALRLQIVFEHRDSIRFVGDVGIRFLSASGGSANRMNAVHFSAWREDESSVTVNARQSLRRYGFEMKKGSIELDAPWNGEIVERADVFITPDQSGDVDLSVDEYWSTWVRPERGSFEEALKAVEDEFSAFASSHPIKNEDWAEATTLAKYILWSCTVGPSGLFKREAVFMSLNWMDQVWSWDNYFNLCGIVPLDPELAFDQLLLMADNQDEFGCYPDGVNDGFRHYNYSKPPVQGILMEWAEHRNPGFMTESRKRACYETVSKFTHWWLNHRRKEGSALCHGYHGNDIGWDNGAMMREGAPLIAPDVNVFLAEQCRYLSRIASEIGREEDAPYWKNEYEALTEAILTELWTGEQFAAVHLPSGRKITSDSHPAALPILLGEKLPRSIKDRLLQNIRKLITPHGFASESPDSPYYEAEGYWRGPIWPPIVMLVVIGLEKAGESDMAKEVARGYCNTCRRSGMSENFEATTGKALVDPSYTWTSASFLEMLRFLGKD